MSAGRVCGSTGCGYRLFGFQVYSHHVLQALHAPAHGGHGVAEPAHRHAAKSSGGGNWEAIARVNDGLARDPIHRSRA